MNSTSDSAPVALDRRGFLTILPTCAVAAAVASQGHAAHAEDIEPSSAKPWPEFPRTDYKLIQEMVGVCHTNETRVRELVDLKPELVHAAWDWGFGDTETALGAAAHTGRRNIAEFLLQHGARIDIFAAAMLGMTDAVKAMVTAMPGIQKALGPHGITLMAHAKAGGETAKETVAYLESLGDADRAIPTHSLSPEQQDVYLGKYPFGDGPEDRVVVKLSQSGNLQFAFAKESPRNLLYIGEHEFFPSGAPSMRIRFDVENGKAKSLTVIDKKPVFTVMRKGA